MRIYFLVAMGHSTAAGVYFGCIGMVPLGLLLFFTVCHHSSHTMDTSLHTIGGGS